MTSNELKTYCFRRVNEGNYGPCSGDIPMEMKMNILNKKLSIKAWGKLVLNGITMTADPSDFMEKFIGFQKSEKYLKKKNKY